MGAWRVFLREHRWLALWLIAAALAVKALVPQGYMLADTGGKTLTVAICDGSGPATAPPLGGGGAGAEGLIAAWLCKNCERIANAPESCWL